MSEKIEQLQTKIAKNKGERDQLIQGMKELFAEDFRHKFQMDIDNLNRAIKRDEDLLKTETGTG